MISIVTGLDIFKAAKEICDKSDVCLAVSYWGYGAAKELGITADSDVRIALDVNAGGTNPSELKYLSETIETSRIKIHKDLHTKIYASKTLALVGSANASASGLNIDGEGHAEACLRIEGDEALQAYNIANYLFEKHSEKFNPSYLRKCIERFGKSTVGNRITGGSYEYEITELLKTNPDLIGYYPVILSDGDMDPNIEEKELRYRESELRELHPDAPHQKISSLWELYGWELPKKLFKNSCIAVHRDDDRNIYVSLVKLHTPKNGHTPAMYTDWNEIDSAKEEGKDPVGISSKKNRELYEILNRIIEEKPNDSISGEDFVEQVRKGFS